MSASHFKKVYAQTRVSSVHVLPDPGDQVPFGTMTFVKLSLHLQGVHIAKLSSTLARNPPQIKSMSDNLLSLAGWYILPNVSSVSLFHPSHHQFHAKSTWNNIPWKQ